MGTNLSQVFVQNGAILETGSDFTGTDVGQVGLWQDGAFAVDALFQKTFSPLDSDTDSADGSTPTVNAALTFANPAWLVKELQVVQGQAGNPIATPLIATSAIKRLSVDVYQATAGHKAVVTPNASFAAANVNSVTLKVIVRTTPTDQLSFYDQIGSNLSILSGNDPFPLGAFNTTNHKAISVEFNCTNTATFCSAGKVAIDGHALLSKLVTVTDTGTGTSLDLQSKHVGFTFDVVVIDNAGASATAASAAANKVVVAITGQVLGTGNAWQVAGEEIRCQSRVGNFNRMYLPQTIATLAKAANEYHKITIEYAHNWPSSTGIAPAGELNQVVLYIGADDAILQDTTSQNITTPFGITNDTNVLESAKYAW
jgi:hypothetical protein